MEIAADFPPRMFSESHVVSGTTAIALAVGRTLQIFRRGEGGGARGLSR